MNISFDIPPEEFSAVVKWCCYIKHFTNHGRLLNAPIIFESLLRKAASEHIESEALVEEIHGALELCETVEGGSKVFINAFFVVISSPAPSEKDLSTSLRSCFSVFTKYAFSPTLIFLPLTINSLRLKEPYHSSVKKELVPLLSSKLCGFGAELLSFAHVYSVFVSSGFISCNGV
jgi:hypothetical protein